MDPPATPPVGTANHTTRIEALTDGVFAIVMTLMVFDIRVAASGQLWQDVAELWPELLAYAISFVQLGIYWTGHRNQLNFIVREDHLLRWISMLFLALVALIPFSTEMISNYLDSWPAMALYGAHLIAISLVLYLHWRYATSGRRLVDPALSPTVVRVGVRRTLTAPTCYAVAVGLGLIAPAVSLVVFALVPVLYVLPGIMDWVWPAQRRLSRPADALTSSRTRKRKPRNKEE